MRILCFEAGGGIEPRMINVSILRAILRVKDLRYRQDPKETSIVNPDTQWDRQLIIPPVQLLTLRTHLQLITAKL